MRKITLKITAFLCLTMFAFQVQAQIVEGTNYNLINNGTGNFIKSDNTNVYMVDAAIADDIGYNFSFLALPDTDPVQWNIMNGYRGAMRGAGTRQVVHTTFQPDTAGAEATDKHWNITSEVIDGFEVYRFEIASGGDDRFLYEGTDGKYYNITVAEMNDAEIAYTDGEDRSYWAAVESTIEPPLSAEEFDTSSVFISNPVSDQLSIQGLTANVNKVSVYNLLGSSMLTKIIDGESTINLNVSGLAAGMYIVKLEGSNGTFSKKIVKQ